MSTRVHGVIGGPRQKKSKPRTKVDRTNYLPQLDELGPVEAVIISTDDGELVANKLDDKESEPEEGTVDDWLLKLSRQGS